jgi:hypothetical protein
VGTDRRRGFSLNPGTRSGPAWCRASRTRPCPSA